MWEVSLSAGWVTLMELGDTQSGGCPSWSRRGGSLQQLENKKHNYSQGWLYTCSSEIPSELNDVIYVAAINITN